MQDLLSQDKNSKWNTDNFDDVLHWHESVDGDAKDEVAWRSKCKVFNDKKRVNKKIQQTKAEWGTYYELESWSGFFKTLFYCLKRMIFKNIEH